MKAYHGMYFSTLLCGSLRAETGISWGNESQSWVGNVKEQGLRCKPSRFNKYRCLDFPDAKIIQNSLKYTRNIIL